MPCSCDHLESTPLEKEASKLVALLDELNKKGKPKSNFGDGYDKRVYNKITRAKADILIARLCGKLGRIKGIDRYSLEMQIWWRDHQASDKKKAIAKQRAARDKHDLKKALGKLTPRERALVRES
ncbi:MAG: hypothetical protein CMG78_12140 [Marinobacter sp.]|nr:hypothetical protein [Marinobacter sp.]|tara:strand:- start:1280 stop:1654 length:375 start_codon:yes stop_codon:yes gene_type:complete